MRPTDSDIAPEAAEATDGPQPLDGLLVVDLTRYLPGPLVARLLGDLGARVIKVEEPSLGDPSRQAPPVVSSRSSLATLLLSGHESLALDLRKPVAQEALAELLEGADVLLESFRPGVLAGWGLAPKDLRERFPELVIASVSGWGQEGPQAHRAGHDLSYQAIAGSLASTATMPSVQVADMVGGWSAATAVLAALYRRQEGSGGCWIDQSLHEAAAHSAMTAWAAEASGPKAVGEALPLTGALPCYSLYSTRGGGHLAMAALEPKFWRRFCEAVERPDLIGRQYSEDPDVRQEVAELVAARSREEWARLMNEHDIPAEPVLSAEEAMGHPQLQARGLLAKGQDGFLRLGFPALFDGRRPRARESFPHLGAHTDQLVGELGLAAGLGSLSRRRGGIGRRFSVRRWLATAAAGWASRRRSS